MWIMRNYVNIRRFGRLGQTTTDIMAVSPKENFFWKIILKLAKFDKKSKKLFLLILVKKI